MSLIKDTKERLLDAAEELFAKNGYHHTSLRAITGEAQANVAAVNYHFGSKEALMTAVLERRLLPLNRLRLKRLDQVQAVAAGEKRRPRTKDVLLAFIEPTLKFKQSSRGAKNFITLIGRAITEPDNPVRGKFIELIAPVAQHLFGSLLKARPDIPKEVLHIRLFFVLGALNHAMIMDDNWPSLAEDIPTSCEAHALIHHLIPFITAGMEASP